MIPTVISWIPPSSSTTSRTVAIPGTNWPATLKPIATGIARNAIAEKMKPSIVAACSGTCENEEIASRRSAPFAAVVYFVSPAKRASRS